MVENGVVLKGDGRWYRCDIDEFLELAEDMAEHHPADPLFITMLRYFGQVCPTAIAEADPYINWWISMENFCTEYHVMPFEGSALDQPVDVLEIFNAIRSIRNEYQWRQSQEHMEEARRLSQK